MSTAPSDGALRAASLLALREVLDPEVGINIVDLGLVYSLEVLAGAAQLSLGMTTAACPLAEQLQRDAEERLRQVQGLTDVQVELVWSPAWTPDRMSPAAKEALGWTP